MRFIGTDATDNVLVSYDEVLSADSPKTLVLDGFKAVHKLKIIEFDVNTKVLHPDNDNTGLHLAIVNLSVKL